MNQEQRMLSIVQPGCKKLSKKFKSKEGLFFSICVLWDNHFNVEKLAGDMVFGWELTGNNPDCKNDTDGEFVFCNGEAFLRKGKVFRYRDSIGSDSISNLISLKRIKALNRASLIIKELERIMGPIQKIINDSPKIDIVELIKKVDAANSGSSQ